MNMSLGSYTIPVASLNAFTMASIALLIPILDLFVYPMLNRFNKGPTMLQRIGCGILLGVLCLVYMGVLEIFRKNDIAANGGSMQLVGTIMYNSSSISILWQIPQFVLCGIAEVFTLVTALEFAYTESPVEMQGMTMGLNYLTTCLGHLLGSVLYVAVANITAKTGSPWLTDEINDGHLDWFVFLLAGILFINFIVFVIVARGYRYCCLGTQQPLIPRSRADQPSKTFGESPIDC